MRVRGYGGGAALRSARFPLVELRIDGTVRPATAALLLVTQDEPSPGLLGIPQWDLTAQLESHLPENPEFSVEATTTDGRVFRGQANVAHETISSSHRGTTWRLELSGIGPLDGLDPELDLH